MTKALPSHLLKLKWLMHISPLGTQMALHIDSDTPPQIMLAIEILDVDLEKLDALYDNVRQCWLDQLEKVA